MQKGTGYRTEQLTLILYTGGSLGGRFPGFEALEVFLTEIAVGGDVCMYW